MDPLVAGGLLAVASASIGAILAWAGAERGESRRQSHADAMYWREVRLDAVTRVLGAADDYMTELYRYGLRRELVARALSDWGPPPESRGLWREFARAELVVPSASPVGAALAVLHGRLHLIPTTEPDVNSEAYRSAQADVLRARGALEDAIRAELGLVDEPDTAGEGSRLMRLSRWLQSWRHRSPSS